MAEVFVVDRVITAPGCARAFLDAYFDGYAPGARQRGMTLRDVLVAPPIESADQRNTVTITWTLPSPQAWWQMTWQARPNAAVAGWWDDVADLVLERDRTAASAADDVADELGSTLPSGTTGAATFSVTRLLDVDEVHRDRILASVHVAADRSGAARTLVRPTSGGSRNGGDVLVHLRFRDQEAWESSGFDAALADDAITRVNGATYCGAPTRRGTGSVYRTLLLRVPSGVDSETMARFEKDLAMMPRYVPTITAWQLSRVNAAVGTSEWTHVFEQEFTDTDGLMGPYLMHPVHWAVVDRWFDPETSDAIIRDRVCHSFCELPAPMLG